jgi:hypothetical protein
LGEGSKRGARKVLYCRRSHLHFSSLIVPIPLLQGNKSEASSVIPPLRRQGVFIFKKYTTIKAKYLLIKTVFLPGLILSIQKYF